MIPNVKQLNVSLSAVFQVGKVHNFGNLRRPTILPSPFVSRISAVPTFDVLTIVALRYQRDAVRSITTIT